MNFNVIKLWISFKKWKKMLEKYKKFYETQRIPF